MACHLGLKKSHCGVDQQPSFLKTITGLPCPSHSLSLLPLTPPVIQAHILFLSPPSCLSIQAQLPHTKETVIIPQKRDQYLLILFMSLHTLFLSPSLPRSSSPPHTYRQDPFTGTPQTGSLKIIINIDPERERTKERRKERGNKEEEGCEGGSDRPSLCLVSDTINEL